MPKQKDHSAIIFLIMAIIALIATVSLLSVSFSKPVPPRALEGGRTWAPQRPDQAPVTPPPAQPLPEKVTIAVPFTPQAPTANWDELHREACEEASAIMAYEFFNGNTEATLSPAEVEKEIDKLTAWQDQHLGHHLDANTEETSRMIREVYGLTTNIVPFDETAIKRALAQGKLVIFTGNGIKLKNPNFRQPGPPYHMLVITGYDNEGFITNDPGTRKGRNYRYTLQTLTEASGTWDYATKSVDLAKKNVIIVDR